MQFSLIAVLGLAAAAVSAAPLDRRAVFTGKTYDQLSISGGKAGNAKAEALAKLSGLPADLKSVEKADLNFLDSVNKIANKAEKGAFNPAIKAASGAAKDALDNGKTKNKVLKLTATVLKLQAQQAKGQDVSAKLSDEQKKLAHNIAKDVAAKGKPSTALKFTASTKS